MSTLTYEAALGIFYPTIVWKSNGNNVYSQIQWISGPPIPPQATLDADIASYDFNGGIISQFLFGSIPQMIGTSQIPFDNTVPLISEGFQVWTRTLSPSVSGSLITLRGSMTVDSSVNSRYVTATIFANNTCIGASSTFITTAGRVSSLSFNLTYTQSSVDNIVFSMRAGLSGSGTTHINQGMSASMGGSLASEYSIMELQQ